MRKRCIHTLTMKPGFLLRRMDTKRPKVEKGKDTHWSNKKNVLLFLAKVQNRHTSSERVRNLIGQMVLAKGVTLGTKEAIMLCDDPYDRSIRLSVVSKYETMDKFRLQDTPGLGRVCTTKDDKITEINLQMNKPILGLDHVMANTFRHIGQHAKVWRSCSMFRLPRFPPNLDYFRNVEVLDLALVPGTDKSMMVYTELPDLSMMIKMRIFNMGEFCLCGQFPQWIHEWYNLEQFCVCGTMLEGHVPDSIRKCTKLVKFCINHTQVSENIPPGILECTHMKILKIQTHKRDSQLRKMDHLWKAMPELQTLHVSVEVPLDQVDFTCACSCRMGVVSVATNSTIRPDVSIVNTLPAYTNTGYPILHLLTNDTIVLTSTIF